MKNKNKNKEEKAIIKLPISEDIKNEIKKVVGNKTNQFVTALITIQEQQPKLKECNPADLIRTCLKAVSLNLVLDNSIGQCYVVPYETKDGIKPQLQIGYRGFVQLALNTKEYKKIVVTDVRKGEIKKYDRLKEEIECEFEQDDEKRKELPIIGYACYFELINGFSKLVYMPVDKLLEHGRRFSKTFDVGPWKTDTDEMCRKTILKLTLSKWGKLTPELVQAIKYDQAIIEEKEGVEVIEYPDNPIREKQQQEPQQQEYPQQQEHPQQLQQEQENPPQQEQQEPKPPQQPQQQERTITTKQKSLLYIRAKEAKITDELLHKFIKMLFNKDSVTQINNSEFNALLDYIHSYKNMRLAELEVLRDLYRKKQNDTNIQDFEEKFKAILKNYGVQSYEQLKDVDYETLIKIRKEVEML